MTLDPRTETARRNLAAMHEARAKRVFFTITLPAFVLAVWFLLHTLATHQP